MVPAAIRRDRTAGNMDREPTLISSSDFRDQIMIQRMNAQPGPFPSLAGFRQRRTRGETLLAFVRFPALGGLDFRPTQFRGGWGFICPCSRVW
jgi:hypothetical protein